jgi:hypothetical protein
LNNAALTYAIDRQFDRSYDAFARAKRHVQGGAADMKHLDLNLALVYAVDGKLDLAEQTAAPYLSKEGLYNNMGFYSYLAKNNDMAKGYLNMALTQSPTYYERAWKNLGALTGDPAAGTGSQPMPANMPAAAPASGLESNLIPPAPASASAAISLDDIPESKGVETKPADTKKTKAKSAPVASPDSSDAEDKVPAPVSSSSSVSANSPVQPPAADINPDVVLLHKPVPAQNSDWDVNKKSSVSSDGGAGATPGGMPAASGSTGN